MGKIIIKVGGKKLSDYVILLLMVISVIMLSYFTPEVQVHELYSCYQHILVQLIIFVLVFFYLVFKKNIDIIEPISLITVIHLLLFEITPLISIYSNDILWFDEYVWDGCILATWISTLGYFFLLFGYFGLSNNKMDYGVKKTIKNPKKIYRVNLMIWAIAFMSNCIYLVTEGKNVLYILTFGGSGTVDANLVNNSSFAFLGAIAYAMISSYLYIFVLSKNKLIKCILFYLMLSSFFLCGFRFIIVAVIVSPLILICLKNQKRLSIVQVLIVLLLLSFMVGFVGLIRDSVRIGEKFNDIFSILNVEYIKDILIENFSIYKTYYGIVANIPSKMGYTMGSVMIIYTLVMFIPRGIWPNKPYPISQKVNAIAVSEYASKAGTAYPYIGEYYHEFGICGVCIFMFLLGKICKYLKKYIYKKDLNSMVLYSSIFPLLLQIMIRGYTPSNFYLILFVMFPIIISKKYSKYM